MYERFFEFRENPFYLGPDPRFLWPSETHQEGLFALTYGIESRSGFILLTGEPGSGKTTLLRAALDQLPANTVTALVFNTAEIEPRDLLKLILADLGIETAGESKADQLIALHRFLLHHFELGLNVVVVIDEAQNLTQKNLEEVRLLSNFETDTQKLMQIVLTGQPELLHKLSMPQLRQLRHRIAIEHHIEFLRPDEVGAYLRHRIEMAGGDYEKTFEKGAEGIFFQASRGCPRLISLLANKALLAAFSKRTRPVPHEILVERARQVQAIAAREQPGAPGSPAPSRKVVSLGPLRAGLEAFGIAPEPPLK